MIIKYIPNNTLRIKLLGSCNLNCSFCHKEGGDNSTQLTKEQLKRIIKFAKKNGYSKLHFTGGEPTLLKEKLIELIKIVTKSGLNCSLTSNGQTDKKLFAKLKNAGLSSINFSLHTIEAQKWVQLQGHKNFKLAQKQIRIILENIKEANEIGLKVKINIAVAGDKKNVVDIIERFTPLGIEIRLLNILGMPKSLKTIKSILLYLKAKPFSAELTLGSSRYSIDYLSKIGIITFKCIDNGCVYDTICSDCKGRCLEGFYGVRIEAIGDKLFARLCLNNENQRTYLSLSAFAHSRQLDEIKTRGGIDDILRLGGVTDVAPSHRSSHRLLPVRKSKTQGECPKDNQRCKRVASFHGSAV